MRRCSLGLAAVFAFSLVIGCAEDRPRQQVDAPHAGDAAAFRLTIEPTADKPGQVAVVVTGEAEDWFPVERLDEASFRRRILALYLTHEYEAPGGDAPTAMLGDYAWDRGKLVFRPRFELVGGERYLARFDPGPLAKEGDETPPPLIVEYTPPDSSKNDAPHVEAIYPSGDVVPANHLKFYLLFDRPMQRGDIFGHFRLFDLTANEEVPGPFRLTELWSRNERRLTLWFHPGRQKEGVNLNVELGPILMPEHRYRLVISGRWRSAEGRELGDEVTKEFTAGPVDREQPDVQQWTVAAPAAGSTAPLQVRFAAPLDWALLSSELRVEDGARKPVPGEILIDQHETRWRFFPAAAWKSGSYRLAVGAVLEDLAGNSLERPFERDLNATSTPPATDATVYREFRIAP